MDSFKDVFVYLNSSMLVAEIQHYFGVDIAVENHEISQVDKGSSVSETTKNTCTDDKESEKQKKAKLLRDVSKRNSKYETKNKFWYYLFRISSCFGDEIFYASMIPFWFWNIDGAVGRRIVAIWALSMYIGQSLKDVIQWPRPRCPPCARLITKQVEEFGMPSTHALVAEMVAAALLFYTSNRYEYRAWIGVILAVVWCALISISRIYLGMHSVLDVVAGLALGVVLLPVLLPFVDWMDSFFFTHPTAPIVLLVTSITLLILAPDSVAVQTKEDTTIVLSSGVGLLIGSWLAYTSGHIRGPPLSPPYTILWPSSVQLMLMVLRMVLGLFGVVMTRHYGKKLSTRFMLNLLQWYKKQDLSQLNQDQFVVLGCRFLTYSALGINVCYTIPVFFKMIGIERPNFHTEV